MRTVLDSSAVGLGFLLLGIMLFWIASLIRKVHALEKENRLCLSTFNALFQRYCGKCRTLTALEAYIVECEERKAKPLLTPELVRDIKKHFTDEEDRNDEKAILYLADHYDDI